MIFYLMLYLVSGFLHQYLHRTPALDNQCSNQNNIGLNYLVGEKYFYNYFTQGGNYIDFSKLTFILWVKFVDNNPYKSTGRQILFQLVDGSDDNPYVNLQLSVFPSNGQLQLALYSGNVLTSYKPQYQMSLSNVANANKLLGWNQIVISIDQSMATSYLNIKLYDSSKNTNYQLQVPNINGTIFTYRISQQTRLTNEALIGQYKVDTRACAFIANFHYYIGWITMDTEVIQDYSSQQVFYVQPNGVTLDSLINQIQIKSQSGMFYDSQNQSIHIFKSTRLEYVFKQQMDSFIMSFWINPNIITKGNINPNYQLFSLTDDSLLNTAIGLGINNQLQLLMYQRFSTKSIAQLDVGWTHIIAYIMQNSWDNDFISQSIKLMTIYVNGVNVTQFQIDNIFQWSRIVIGFLFRDVQDDNYVQMREIQMYSGMSLQKSKYGCLIQSDNYCILCDPKNQIFIASQCPQTQPTYQSCQIGTTACNISASQGIIKYYSILCQDQYVYNSPTCIKGSAFPCGLSMNKGCADCQTGTLKTLSSSATRCIPECISVIDGTYNFNDNGICRQVCPYYATYTFDCYLNVTVVKCFNQCPSGYMIVNNGICQHPDFAPILPLNSRKHDPIKGLIYDYINFTPSSNLKDYATYKNAQLLFPNKYFDPTLTQLQYFKGCQKIPFFYVQQNVTQLCIYPCGLCYSTTKTSCLTCQDPNQFLDRQFSSCVKSCDQSFGILKLNHRLTMTCEQTCPQGFYKQEVECVSSCSQNYYSFNGICTNKIPLGYYINNNTPSPCPQVCKTCTDQSTCQTCVGNYPKNGNMCVYQCPYFLDFTTNTCVFQCQSSDLIYQTINLNGFAFNVCFKNQCGVVQANKLIQTVQHQTNTKQCAQPCDDGYYADYGVVKCIKCKSPCLTCQDTQDICLTCIQNYFFYLNNCFDKCPDMYEDTINSMCVGGCDVGYSLVTSTVKACVQYCDNNKYGLIAFYYKLQCLITPNVGTYCTGQHCFDCDSSCYSCNGPRNNQCLSCTNLYLYNNTCYTNCPGSLYSISTTWTCQASCPVGTFSMDGQQGCYNPCPAGTYQYSNKCYQSQQQSTYCNLVQKTYICSDCYLTCQACTDKASNTCTQCKIGFYFWQGQCLTKCPKGIYKYNYQCYQQCPSGLKMQDDTCVTTCDSNYISFSNYCGTSCPDGFYQILFFCIPCYLGCATCTSGNSNQCQSCQFGYYFQSGTTCGTSCPAQLPYKNQISNSCDSQCPDTGFINVQADATYCVLKCPSYYYGRLCQTKCPNQTWANGNECRVCDKSCTVCFGDLISQCSSCSTGNYLDQSTCVESCPTQRPFANQVDKKCLTLCPIYTFLESMYCFSSCPSYLYNYELKPASLECVRSCYPGSYISGQYCLACAPQCIQCYEANQNSCLKCYTGYYLSVTTCQSTCPTYYDEVNQTCVPNCDPSQYILNNKCLSTCPQGYLNYMMQCVVACPAVTYKSGLICLQCDYSCLVCQDGTNQQCSKCISNYFKNGSICTLTCPILYDYINYLCVAVCPNGSYLLDKQCVPSCPITYLTVSDQLSCVQQCTTGYYQDGMQCLKCDPICTACTAIDQCQACAEDYALNINKCVQICWSNDKLFYDKVNRLCQSICPNFHYAAYGKYICVDKCDQYYSGQFCVDSCQSGYYGDDQNVCTLCPTNCLECTAIDNCTSCVTNFVLTKGQCSTSCIGQYLDVSTHQCVDACPLNKYLLIDQCLISCPSPQYFGYKFICYQKCPDATFRSQQYCLDCAPECTSCYGPTSSDCESCSKGYYLDNQICTKTCPLNYYYDQQKFVCTLKCDKNLFEFNDTCLEICPILSYYENCVSSCPVHTYQYNLMCQDCKAICQTCNQFECLTCVGGYFLNNGVCEQVCPNLYDQVNNKCVDQCDSTLFLFMNSCLKTCPNLPTYSYQQQCLIQCPESTAIVGNTCQQCQERCQICQLSSVCLECQQGYNLYNGICLVACPIASPYLEDGICGTKCSDSKYYYQKNCVIECPNRSYLQQCVDICPDGFYGDVCSPCKSECKTCSSYQTCNSCNPNYFLEKTVCDTQCPYIYDTIKWECTDSCNGLLNGLLCMNQCPAGLLQQGNLCKNTCDDGYFNENAICTQCPRECQLCTSVSTCQSCSISYYLQGSSCLAKCPIGLFSNPKTNMCIQDCPNNMIKYQTQCLFSCPKGYVSNNQQCTQECSNNQLQIGQICFDCPLECDGCTGLTNSDCIQCSKGTTQNGKLCVSKSCISGYTITNDGFCLQCQFNCLTCDQNSCLTCRGDRKTKLCTCSKGYYDDGVDEICQKCPCDECTSINSCTKCKNNLKTPNCSCDRQLNSDWCIDCNVGRTNIKFSFDLNSIIVEFGYLISINLMNPFQPSSCELWIVNYEILGVDSLCHLVWNRTQVIIELGSQAQVTIGDILEFQQNFYKDVNDQQCSGFISNFIDSTVQSPDMLIKPYIEFDNPQLISNCQKIKIKQVSIWGTGQRELQILQWKLINEQDLDQDHFFQLSDYLQQMGNYLEFDINVLKPNQTYIIQAKYTNILKRLNTSMITFKTNPQQKPYVYLSFNPLTAHAYIFDCQTFQDLQLTYTLSILIQNKQNDTLISENILVVNTYSIIADESKLPRGEILLVTAQIDEIIIRQNVTLQYLPHLLKFKQQSRFLGLQGRITARGHDQNIIDQTIQQMNFKYQWVCTNLHNLEPCKSQQNQIIKFVDSRILQIQLDSPNQTFAFYCNASKDGRWTVEVQKIVLTNLNIKNNFVENTGKSLGNINPNDDIFIILKQPQQYAMIMYQYLLIGTIKINGQGLKFKLANYLNESHGDIAIYLLPSNESLKYTINFVKVLGQLEVDPKEGYSLDQFTITMNITNIDKLDGPLKYGFFEYLKQSQLEDDVANYQNVNGIPLGQFQSNNTIKAHLTNGLQNVYILSQVIDIKGFVVFFNETIVVKRKYYSYQQNINMLPKKNQSLQQINAALQMLKEESKQVCLKQCSGVGTCIQGKCQCPPGYYFDDCSGTKADTEIQKQYISNTLDELYNQSIADDEQYKLFIKSLSYLTTYQESFDKFNSEKALVQLGIVTNSLSNRINKINQLTINLQLNSIDSLQYDSLDIGQTVQMSDLKQTMQCHDLIWFIILQNKTGSEKYQIQYQTRQIIQQIIQLSFYILKPDDFVDFSGAGGTLLINRSNQSIVQTKGRILSTVPQQYDLVQAKYLNNLYQDDGYFPYPKQNQPLYDYSIRIAGRQQNIQLQYTINYTFKVESQNRFICIMRNQTNFGWEYQNCNTTYANKTIQCNCTLLAPTTIVDDQDYLVMGNGQKRLELPNFISIILFIQTFLWICLLLVGLKQDRQILDSQIVHNNSQQVKYGMVKALNKQVRKSLNLDGIQIEPTTPEPFNDHHVIHNTDHDEELFAHHDHDDHQHQLIQNNIAQKYSLENFQKQHSILNIIYKYKKFQPRWFRSTLILMRWTLCITIAGLFAYLQLLYEVSVYPTLGAFLFSRMMETFINQQFKQTSYIDSVVLKLIYLTFIFVIIISSILGFGVIYTQIENQTDWIISYLISFTIDILLLDLISMIANKYLGEDVKIRLRKQIKRIKKLHEMQKQVKSREDH